MCAYFKAIDCFRKTSYFQIPYGNLEPKLAHEATEGIWRINAEHIDSVVSLGYERMRSNPTDKKSSRKLSWYPAGIGKNREIP